MGREKEGRGREGCRPQWSLTLVLWLLLSLSDTGWKEEGRGICEYASARENERAVERNND